MKRFLMMTSAIGLCLAAPALAQTTSGQDPSYPPRAAASPSAQPPGSQPLPDQAAPARSGQPRSANTGQPQPPRGQAQNQQNQQQQPSTSGQAQNNRQPARDGQAQNQQPPARDGQAQNRQQQPASSDRAGSNQNQNDRDRAQGQRDRAQNQRQPAGGSSTNAQAPDDRQRSAAPNRDQRGEPDRRQSQDRQQRDRRRDAQNARARDNDAARLKATIDDRQRTRIASVISSARVRPIDVNFRIETGIVIPATVTLAPLPSTIVEIVPQYRGYRYFVTREQIVIVEPRKKVIVDVIPLGGAARAQAPAAKRVTFTEQQRDIIRRQTSSVRAPATTGSGSTRIVVEQEVPEAVELQEFPAEIVTEVPVVRTYRYFRQDDDVVVVDPIERRVIEIIR